MMPIHDPPLENWKANPTTTEGFDWALYPRNAHPRPRYLDEEDLATLLDRYERVKIPRQNTRLRVLVAETEEDAES